MTRAVPRAAPSMRQLDSGAAYRSRSQARNVDMAAHGDGYQNALGNNRDSVLIVVQPMIYRQTTRPKPGNDTKKAYQSG